MRSRTCRLVAFAAVLLATSSVARAQATVQVAHDFAGGATDGASPEGGLILATDGNFYGTTSGGGAFGGGTIFRMTPSGTITVLHSFGGGVSDGLNPADPLVQATDGDFYGTTTTGGVSNLGTVFKITSAGTFTLLHSFAGGTADGGNPLARLIQASDGDLYGTTPSGGALNLGTAFKITLTGAVTVLHSFAGQPNEGAVPRAALIEGADGNFYGTTTDVVILSSGMGTVFKMTPSGTVTVLHFFAGGSSDGQLPQSALVQATDGNFYGTTLFGGAAGRGTIFRVTPSESFSLLHSFDGSGVGEAEAGDLIMGTDGNVYGTTRWLGDVFYFGPTVFRMTPSGAYTVLHAFGLSIPGSFSYSRPGARLVQASDGSFYGTVKYGGTSNLGEVFRLTLPPPVTGFDDDAKTDMPLYNGSTGQWRILTSNSDHRSSLSIYWGGPGFTPVAADYDGDGRLDVAVYHAATGSWHVLTSSSNFTGPGRMASWGGPGYVPVPGDYDGDGKADFAVYRQATGDWYILQSGAGYTTARTVHLGGIGAVPVPGDYDGDRTTDVAVYQPATGVWTVLTSSSNYTATLSKTLGGPGYAPVLGDYDGDGKTDFAVYDQAMGYWSVLQSSTAFTTTWTQGWGGTGYTAVPGDYDGDGHNDLAVYYVATGDWYVLQSGSDFTTTLHAEWGAPLDTVVTSAPVRLAWTDATRASDYDGDGRSDVAVYEPATGVWSILESSSNFTTTRTATWGAAGDTPVPGDYDGDGRTDLAVFDGASGLWSVQLSGGGTLTVSLGAAGDVPVPRDYDGDLSTDIAVYTPATGEWRFLLSSTGFAAETTVTWGGAGWTAVPGDYDGDGKADFGLYEQSTGHWQILLAADNDLTALTADWGGTAYTAVPGDYDGDGKDDFAVYRRATGQWYMLKSGTNYTTALGCRGARRLTRRCLPTTTATGSATWRRTTRRRVSGTSACRRATSRCRSRRTSGARDTWRSRGSQPLAPGGARNGYFFAGRSRWPPN